MVCITFTKVSTMQKQVRKMAMDARFRFVSPQTMIRRHLMERVCSFTLAYGLRTDQKAKVQSSFLMGISTEGLSMMRHYRIMASSILRVKRDFTLAALRTATDSNNLQLETVFQ